MGDEEVRLKMWSEATGANLSDLQKVKRKLNHIQTMIDSLLNMIDTYENKNKPPFDYAKSNAEYAEWERAWRQND